MTSLACFVCTLVPVNLQFSRSFAVISVMSLLLPLVIVQLTLIALSSFVTLVVLFQISCYQYFLSHFHFPQYRFFLLVLSFSLFTLFTSFTVTFSFTITVAFTFNFNFKYSSSQVFKCSSAQVLKFSSSQVLRCSSAQVYAQVSSLVLKCSSLCSSFKFDYLTTGYATNTCTFSMWFIVAVHTHDCTCRS